MKLKTVIFAFLIFVISHVANSTGALRFILPALDHIGFENLRVGEMAYDELESVLLIKTDEGSIKLREILDTTMGRAPKVITSITFGPTSLGFLYYSKVSSGTITIGSRSYANTNEIVCEYNLEDPQLGYGYHDGSVGGAVSGYLDTTYLYLVGEENGEFSCIYSHQDDGPLSPYNDRWSRVQTIAGVTPQGTSVRGVITDRGETKIRGTNLFTNSITIETPATTSPVTNASMLTSSMDSIYIEQATCMGAAASLLEAVEFYNEFTSSLETARVQGALDCESETVKQRSYKMNGTGEIHFSGVGGFYMNIQIVGWNEIPLFSH